MTEPTPKSCPLYGSFFYFLSLKKILLLCCLFADIGIICASDHNKSIKRSSESKLPDVQIDALNLQALHALKAR